MLDIFETGMIYKVVNVVHENWSDNHCNNTIQLYCLCVEKFAFWLIIYINTFNKINNKISTIQ